MLNIKKIRASARETQKTFAEKVGVAVRTVQDWEGGQRDPDKMKESTKKLIKLIYKKQIKKVKLRQDKTR